MKHVRTFENKNSIEYLQRDESIQELKKGDKIVYNESSTRSMKYGETYIITGIFDEDDLEVDIVKNGDYISVKNLNGIDVTSLSLNKPMLIYPKRFISLLKYEMNKYNI
jgi:hypothetical protein